MRFAQRSARARIPCSAPHLVQRQADAMFFGADQDRGRWQRGAVDDIRQQLLRCRAALGSFLTGPIEDAELRAEDLRRAAQALGRLVGAIAVEDVLGQIFGRFCIGK